LGLEFVILLYVDMVKWKVQKILGDFSEPWDLPFEVLNCIFFNKSGNPLIRKKGREQWISMN
jgi:hypothetical protein